MVADCSELIGIPPIAAEQGVAESGYLQVGEGAGMDDLVDLLVVVVRCGHHLVDDPYLAGISTVPLGRFIPEPDGLLDGILK